MWESGKNFPAVIPAFLTGSLDLEQLMSMLERVPKPMQAGDNSPVCFQIQGMMYDSKTLNSSFSLNNLGIYWFPLSIPVFFHSPCILFSFGDFSHHQGIERDKNYSIIWFCTHISKINAIMTCHSNMQYLINFHVGKENMWLLVGIFTKWDCWTEQLCKIQHVAFLN